MSDASRYQTEVHTMQVAAQRVTDVAAAIQTDMQRLDGNIQAAMAGWQGTGARAYFALHQRWMDSTAKLTRVLHEISQTLVQNATRYQSAEDAAAQSMVQTAGRLG